MLLTILNLCIVVMLSANTIEVGKDRRGGTLRQAVSLAKSGDTILLYPGVYNEGNIIISRSLHLLGIGSPVLDGELKNELLTLSGHGIVVKGITFRNAGYSSMNDFAAIKVIDATGVRIENNTIENSSFAIHFANSTLSVIRGNTIRGNNKSEHSSGNGIHLWKCSQMLVENNSIEGHRDGIYFEFVTFSVIVQNRSERNIRYGLHFMFSNDDHYEANVFRNNGAGVAVMFSKKVTMVNNHFEENWGAAAYGILLKEIKEGTIIRNTFLKNTVGIFMEGSSRLLIEKNNFRNNGWAVKVQASCDENDFGFNNFFGNSFDISTNGTMMLNRFYSNYWDRYEGYDLDRDGVGDVPFHPVSMYGMIIENNPTTLILLRSFMVSLLDKAEKAIPSLTPENLIDDKPVIKPNRL
ncbi:putative copper ABC transporter substrate-binding protein [Flavihumibacter petaseus NBRC 106054]|uniref:Putative copper ABC transporter substrate-binding protein n=2 Tax=Flavihumibacter TaxID=1004301 RepID=A0A0E9MZ72_9BACT|nr:putative copper ABC transporter substrate-binding protein [Flavihumibacter petaseus NBRC 106054]